MRKTLLARSSPTRVTDEVSMIDLPTDGSLPDGACNDDHLGTLDAVRGAVHPISKCPSSTRLSRCSASLRNTSPKCLRNSPYRTLRRNFGMKTTWYLHSHFE